MLEYECECDRECERTWIEVRCSTFSLRLSAERGAHAWPSRGSVDVSLSVSVNGECECECARERELECECAREFERASEREL